MIWTKKFSLTSTTKNSDISVEWNRQNNDISFTHDKRIAVNFETTILKNNI